MVRQDLTTRTQEAVPSPVRQQTTRPASNVIKHVLQDAVFSAVGALFSRGALFLGVFLTARALGPSKFGLFSLAQTTALLFTTFGSLSFGQMAAKVVAEGRVGSHEDLTKSTDVSYVAALFGGILFALPLIILSDSLSQFVSNRPGQQLLYAISALLVVTGFIIPVQNGISLGLGVVRRQATANLVAAPLVVCSMVVGAMTGSVVLAMFGYVCGQAAVCIAQQVALGSAGAALPRPSRLRRLRRADVSVVWTLALPSSVAGMLTFPVQWFAMLSLSRSEFGVSAVGQFSFANQVRAMMMFAIGIIANATLPQLTRAIAEGRSDDHRRLMRVGALGLGGGTALIAILGVIVIPPVISMVAPTFEGATVAMQVLIASSIPTALSSLYMRNATAHGRAAHLLYGNVAFAMALVPSVLLLVHYGATGLAIAFFVASIVQCAVYILGTTRKGKPTTPR